MGINKLKKLCAVLLCALIAISGTLVCSADTNRYTIDELDKMVITLPDGMTAVTRGCKETDKYFSVFGLNYNTTMDNFKSGDIYLQGMDSSSKLTLTVTMTETADSKKIGNYNLLDGAKLTEVKGNFLNQNEYIACTPDQTNSIVWLNFDVNVKNNGKTIAAYQANTVYDSMSVNITLQRNEGDVTNDDYEVFKQIVSSVDFLKIGSQNSLMIYIIIGACVVAIAVIILIIILAKRAKKRRKNTKNDKILRELADKYKLDERRTGTRKPVAEEEDYPIYEDSDGNGETDISQNTSDFEVSTTYIDSESGFGGKNISSVGYSDDELDAVLADINKSGDKDGMKLYNQNENIEAEKQSDETADNVIYSNSKNVVNDEDYNEQHDNSSDDDSEAKDADGGDFENIIFGSDDEHEDYNNDEELVRQEARKTKFSDSDDFFEEAPKKTMGMISDREIRDAEDYDVINEVEQRVSQLEKEDEDEGVPFTQTLAKAGKGVKNFFVHLGYFCKNVRIMIKRKRSAKKRRKLEAERRERARQRAERERRQRLEMQDGGLVKVHSRSELRPSQNRRPQQSRTGQLRPNQRRK